MQLTHILLLGCCFLSATSAEPEELLELGCVTDAQCAQFEQASCLHSQCICTARDGDQRVGCKPKDEKLTNIIGGPCPCSQPHSECDVQLQQCFCVNGYLPSKDKRRCLAQSVPLNGHCEQHHQCQLKNTFAVCQKSQSRCLCKERFELHAERCLALLDLSCVNDTDCISSGASICLPELSKCACAIGLVQNHNMSACIAGAAYGDECTTIAQCQLRLGAAGMCHNNHCSCRIKHYASIKQHTNNTQQLNSTICVPFVQYGAYCRHDKDCEDQQQQEKQHQQQDEQPQHEKSPKSSMLCMWGECRCRPDHRAVDNEFCVLATGAANQLHDFLPQLLLFTITVWLIYGHLDALCAIRL